MRDAPSIDILRALIERGAQVQAYDPAAMEQTRKILPEVSLCAGEYEACQGADALVIVTEWNQFRMLDLDPTAVLWARSPSPATTAWPTPSCP